MMTFTRLLSGAPLYVVWIGGILLALTRWSRHPRVCALVAAALGLEIVVNLGSTVVYTVMPMLVERSGMSMSVMSTVYGAFGFLQGIVSAAAWALVLLAIFGWRDEQTVAAG